MGGVKKNSYELSGENDSDDEAVDGDSLAEDDGNQVLGLDPDNANVIKVRKNV